MPTIWIEFYKPKLPEDEQRTFEDVLNAIARMPLRQRLRTDFDPMGIFSLDQDGRSYVGDTARIRMEDLPRVVDITTGQRHDINIAAREGLSEEIHFLYDATLDVIAIQKRGMLRASALRDLIGDLTGTGVQFLVILREDAWRRFQRMPLIKKIIFKLARPVDLRGIRRLSIFKTYQQLDEFDGVSSKVEISIERQKNTSLNRVRVRNTVQSFRERGDFISLSVTGPVRDGGEERLETIDFVHDSLKHRENVPHRGRRLDPDGCRLALRRAIRAHRPYLGRYRE